MKGTQTINKQLIFLYKVKYKYDYMFWHEKRSPTTLFVPIFTNKPVVVFIFARVFFSVFYFELVLSFFKYKTHIIKHFIMGLVNKVNEDKQADVI